MTATRLAREVYSAAVDRIAHDFVAGGRDARRVGQRQVGLVGQCLGRGDGDLAGFGVAVILQRRGADAFVH
jgi:hypothetical protein